MAPLHDDRKRVQQALSELYRPRAVPERGRPVREHPRCQRCRRSCYPRSENTDLGHPGERGAGSSGSPGLRSPVPKARDRGHPPDISSAERLNVLKSSTVYYPSGMGYEYSPGTDLKNVQRLAGDFLRQHKGNIDWVLNHFSGRTAGESSLLPNIKTRVRLQSWLSRSDL